MNNPTVLTIPLRQHGNSVGLTIPKPYLDALGLSKGAQVDVELKNGQIEMRPHKDLSLEDLLASYDPAKHNYEDLLPGEVGREIAKE
jgi:antitoxin component of MazEF toxin-antitoxin module